MYCRFNTQLRAWAHRRRAYSQLSPLYLLSTLYVTHAIKYSRPPTAFPYFKRRKAGWGLGTRLALNHHLRSRFKFNYDILCVVSTISFDKQCHSEHGMFVLFEGHDGYVLHQGHRQLLRSGGGGV